MNREAHRAGFRQGLGSTSRGRCTSASRPTARRSSGRVLAIGVLATALLCIAVPAAAFTLEFDSNDFTVTPTFSNVRTFAFSVEVTGPLVAGVYVDPALVGVEYSVSGQLAMTPSGFPSFALQRTIGGAEYYTQGSSLDFEISATADLTDGLQVSELVGSVGVFVFDGREVGTGRYHPALFELNADGTGSIRNSNNMGGVNPGSGQVVDVQIGDEYVTLLAFDPNALTLAVPEPGSEAMAAAALAVLAWLRRTRSRFVAPRD